jgi:hypothetical protein
MLAIVFLPLAHRQAKASSFARIKAAFLQNTGLPIKQRPLTEY